MASPAFGSPIQARERVLVRGDRGGELGDAQLDLLEAGAVAGSRGHVGGGASPSPTRRRTPAGASGAAAGSGALRRAPARPRRPAAADWSRRGVRLGRGRARIERLARERLRRAARSGGAGSPGSVRVGRVVGDAVLVDPAVDGRRRGRVVAAAPRAPGARAQRARRRGRASASRRDSSGGGRAVKENAGRPRRRGRPFTRLRGASGVRGASLGGSHRLSKSARARTGMARRLLSRCPACASPPSSRPCAAPLVARAAAAAEAGAARRSASRRSAASSAPRAPARSRSTRRAAASRWATRAACGCARRDGRVRRALGSGPVHDLAFTAEGALLAATERGLYEIGLDARVRAARSAPARRGRARRVLPTPAGAVRRERRRHPRRARRRALPAARRRSAGRRDQRARAGRREAARRAALGDRGGRPVRAALAARCGRRCTPRRSRASRSRAQGGAPLDSRRGRPGASCVVLLRAARLRAPDFEWMRDRAARAAARRSSRCASRSAPGRVWLATDGGLLEAPGLAGPWRAHRGAGGRRGRARRGRERPSASSSPATRGVFAAELGRRRRSAPGHAASAARAARRSEAKPNEEPEPSVEPCSAPRSATSSSERERLRASSAASGSAASCPSSRCAATTAACAHRDEDHDDTVFASGGRYQLLDRLNERGRDFLVGAALRWELGDTVFDPDEIDVSKEVRELIELRDEVLDEINQLYFERRRVLLERAQLRRPGEPRGRAPRACARASSRPVSTPGPAAGGAAGRTALAPCNRSRRRNDHDTRRRERARPRALLGAAPAARLAGDLGGVLRRGRQRRRRRASSSSTAPPGTLARRARDRRRERRRRRGHAHAHARRAASAPTACSWWPTAPARARPRWRDADLLLDFDFQNGPDSVRAARRRASCSTRSATASSRPGEVNAGEGAPALDPAGRPEPRARLRERGHGRQRRRLRRPARPRPGARPSRCPSPRARRCSASALLGLARRRAPAPERRAASAGAAAPAPASALDAEPGLRSSARRPSRRSAQDVFAAASGR